MVKNNVKNGFVYPKFIELGIVKNIRSRNGTNPVMKYKIDWYDFNKKVEDHYNNWINMHHKNEKKNKFKRTKHVFVLDNFHMNLMTNQEFLIPDHYMKEIKHYAELSNIERLRNQPFDTSVRDTLYSVAEKSVYNSFFLISDCIYDGNVNYSHINVIIWLSSVLAHFWNFQTGRGLIEERASIKKLKSFCLNKNNKNWSNDEIKQLKKWVNSYYKQQDKVSELYEEMTDEEYLAKIRKIKLGKII